MAATVQLLWQWKSTRKQRRICSGCRSHVTACIPQILQFLLLHKCMSEGLQEGVALLWSPDDRWHFVAGPQPALLSHTKNKETLSPETTPGNSYQQLQHHNSGLYAMVWSLLRDISILLKWQSQCHKFEHVSRLLKLHVHLSAFLDHACILLTVLKANKDHQNHNFQGTTGIYKQEKEIDTYRFVENQTSKGL